ncbi:MAG: DNA polymerase/3'-5' exonuclease PolX [Planctomycetaceae bacterium]|nr:DNA polymerase/3'-5' exonuclease PolX [Planctomycetaceae bacterium]
MTNAAIAGMFSDLADLLEIEGANAFRIRAYRNASRTLDSLTDSLEAIVAEDPGKLMQIPGIGKDLALKIQLTIETGQLEQLEQMKEKIPPDVVRMLCIPGIGPKKVAVLFRKLHLTTLDQLKHAAQTGAISQQKGFAKKTEQIILEGLEHLEQMGLRMFLADAKPFVDQMVQELAGLTGVDRVCLAGSVRRLKETVGDLDILVAASAPDQAMDYLANHPQTDKVLARGETKQRVRFHPFARTITPGGSQVAMEMDLRVVPEESFGAALQYFTGSKEHNIETRKRASQRGFKLNEYGLFRGEEVVASVEEKDIYAAIDLPWIPPEIRQDRNEFHLAEAGEIPDLVELGQIRGDLHMHTTATDGRATIEEMIEAAIERKLKYIAITDHSKRVTMANGLDATRLRAHWENIRSIREQYPEIEVLCGIECDILEDATLDLDDEVLAEADFVIAVLHYGLKQPKDQITKRLLNAIKNPHVHMIGHLTGRLLGKRPGAEISFEDVFKAAADHGVLMEINAHPSRLDLNEIHAAQAKELGIPIVINTDAHSTTGLDVMQWGIYQARRAGLSAKDVANTLTAKQFRKLLR